MKKFLLFAAAATISVSVLAQDAPKTSKKKKDWSKVSLGNRANDHFMMQFGWLGWSGAPDSIKSRSWSKTFNMYFMLDMPFKTDPRFSVAIGLGLGTDNKFFDRTNVNITGTTKLLQFQNLDTLNHFKKYKLTTSYLELPVELRFSSNPTDPAKSWKFAVGAKVGLLLEAHTKGKNFEDRNGNQVSGGDYVQKIRNKKYFNGQRLAFTGRIGYGNLSLWGSYAITQLIKDGSGPDVKPINIGLTFSGL